MQALTCREKERCTHTDTPTDTVRRGAGAHSELLLACPLIHIHIHTHTPTHTPTHTVRRGAGAHSEELLLACPLVQPGSTPGNVIQEVGAGVHIRLVNAVTVLALVRCCKPAVRIRFTVIVPSQYTTWNACSGLITMLGLLSLLC